MIRLNYYILALTLWLGFFFNIERLDFPDANAINIAPSTYILSIGLVVLGIVLPQRLVTPIWTMGVFAALLFILVKLLGTRPYWGGEYTYLTLFEFTATILTATLAQRTGSSSADFIRTVREMLFTEKAARVHTAEESLEIIRREVLYSRRRNRAFSVMVLEANTDGAKVDLSATAREIERLFIKRYSLVVLGRLFTQLLRRTDLVIEASTRERLVLLIHDIRREQAGTIMERLCNYAEKPLGIALQFGLASFPDEGLTFDQLVENAERDLRGPYPERRKEGAVSVAPMVVGENS